MKKLTFIHFFCLLMLFGHSVAQDIRFWDRIEFAPQFQVYVKYPDGGVSQIRALTQKSELLERDFTGYNTYTYSNITTIPHLSPYIQFRLGRELGNFVTPKLRLGFSGYRESPLSLYHMRTTSYTIDTLVSAQTGAMLVLDSIHYSRFGARYSHKTLRADVALLLYTPAATRLQFYTGIGLNLGTVVDARTSIYQYESATSRYANDNNYYYLYFYGSPVLQKQEELSYKNSMAYSLYVPLAIDFQLVRKHKYWNWLHIFYEFRGGYDRTKLAAAPTLGGTYMQHGLGLRLKFKE